MLFAAVALGVCTSGTRPSVVKQLEACALIAPSSCPFSGLTQGALQAAKVLAQLKQVAPQWSIDGPDNIWILKPGGKSRGRGIHCFNSLQKLRLQARSTLYAAAYCPTVSCTRTIVPDYIKGGDTHAGLRHSA